MTAAPTRRTIQFGSAEIPYTLTVRPRRDLLITVHPNLEVAVVAPAGKSIQQIEVKVRARAAWILRQQLRFRDLHPLPTDKRFVSGETHLYLGRQYRLRIIRSSRDRVTLSRPFLLVEVKNASTTSRVEKLVKQWYSDRATAVIPRQFERCLEAHPSLRMGEPRLRMRRMSRRWGSCTPLGVVTLNPELVRVPIGCIEYVIVHELCHRKVMNHGPGFERMLSRTLPDWRARQNRLNRIG